MKIMYNANVQYVKGIKEKNSIEQKNGLLMMDIGHVRIVMKKIKKKLWTCFDCQQTLKKCEFTMFLEKHHRKRKILRCNSCMSKIDDAYKQMRKRDTESLQVNKHFCAVQGCDEFGRQHWTCQPDIETSMISAGVHYVCHKHSVRLERKMTIIKKTRMPIAETKRLLEECLWTDSELSFNSSRFRCLLKKESVTTDVVDITPEAKRRRTDAES